MTPLPKRRLPSRADEAALSALRTRRPTIAGSTRWTNEGSDETSRGLSRRSGAEVGAPTTTVGASRRVARTSITTRFIELLSSFGARHGFSALRSTVPVLSLVERPQLPGLHR